MMTPPKTDGMDKNYAMIALRVLTGPRNEEWHNQSMRLLDHAPDYGFPRGEDGDATDPRDVFQVAGLILGYCAGIVEWTPTEP